MKKSTIHFVGGGIVAVGEGNIDESNGTISDYSCLFWHTDFIQDGAMEKMKVNGKNYLCWALEHHSGLFDVHNENIPVVDADKNFATL